MGEENNNNLQNNANGDNTGSGENGDNVGSGENGSSTAGLTIKELESAKKIIEELREKVEASDTENMELRKMNMKLALGVASAGENNKSPEELLHNMFNGK